MKIGLASDHGGFELKEKIRKYLEEKDIDLVDFGTYSEDSVDYPDYGQKLGEAVVRGEVDRGIAVCGTGIGISIAANKVRGVRCALCSNEYSAKMSRHHNNANILALGGRVTGEELAYSIVDAYLENDFDGGRHERRVEKIMAIEE